MKLFLLAPAVQWLLNPLDALLVGTVDDDQGETRALQLQRVLVSSRSKRDWTKKAGGLVKELAAAELIR